MAKKEYTRESISADIEAFVNGKFSKTNMTIDFMDAYVAFFKPETIDTWIAKCLAIPMTTREIGGVEKSVKDSKKIRAYFIETYFPEHTDEAKKQAKEAKKKAKDLKKQAEEAEKAMSPADRLRQKMNRLANQ